MNIFFAGAIYRLLKRFCKDVVWDIFIGKTVDAIYKLSPKRITSPKRDYSNILFYVAILAIVISAPFLMSDIIPIHHMPTSTNHTVSHHADYVPTIA